MTEASPPSAVVSLGSNLGDRLGNLRRAVAALADTPHVRVVGASRVFETGPVDAPPGSPPFLNAVVLLETALPPRALLERALAVEAKYGRVRTGTPREPRSLDVDLVAMGDRRCNDAALVLPHPRAHERAFVLVPWLDVDPQATLLGHGPVSALVAALDTRDVRRRDDLAWQTP